MRKNYLWMAVIASMLSFTACNDDASSIVNGENPDEVVMDDGTTFELAISNTGIGTRAARPLGSSAAANTVDKVQLKFYSSKDGKQWTEAPAKFKITHLDGAEYKGMDNTIAFNETKPEGVPGTTDRIEEKHKIKMTGMEKSTHYRIVAYGYNGVAFPYGTEKTDPTTLGLFSTGDNHGKDGYALEEVFAGYKDVTTAATPDKNGVYKFTGAPAVEITRQVAGILAYFKIPTHANGEIVKTVKVIANQKSTGFKFPNTLLKPDNVAFFNGTGTTAPQIGDGTVEPKSGDVLMEFDMATAASNWNNGSPAEDYYTTNGGTADYVVPASQAKGLATGYKPAEGLKLKADAFFGARYVLPYDKHYNAQTLKVVMYGIDGKVLKTLKVTTDNVPTDGSTYNYDIRCNNFYSIGRKMATDNTDGNKPDPENPDPEYPDPKPDTPIDLGSTDQIVVEINDAWDVLHNMGVEEE